MHVAWFCILGGMLEIRKKKKRKKKVVCNPIHIISTHYWLLLTINKYHWKCTFSSKEYTNLLQISHYEYKIYHICIYALQWVKMCITSVQQQQQNFKLITFPMVYKPQCTLHLEVYKLKNKNYRNSHIVHLM